MRRAPDVWNDGIIIIIKRDDEHPEEEDGNNQCECLHAQRVSALRAVRAESSFSSHLPLLPLFSLLCLSVALCIVTCSLFQRRKGTTGPCVLCWSDCPFESRKTGKHTTVTQLALVCAVDLCCAVCVWKETHATSSSHPWVSEWVSLLALFYQLAVV